MAQRLCVVLLSLLFVQLSVASAASFDGKGKAGLVTIGGKEYYIDEELAVPWMLATEHCNSLGLSLMSLETQQEDDSVQLYLQASGFASTQFWTSGLYVNSTPLAHWMWTGSGKILTNTSWLPGEPNNLAGPCTALYIEGGNWRDTSCGDLLFYMCE